MTFLLLFGLILRSLSVYFFATTQSLFRLVIVLTTRKDEISMHVLWSFSSVLNTGEETVLCSSVACKCINGGGGGGGGRTQMHWGGLRTDPPLSSRQHRRWLRAAWLTSVLIRGDTAAL